MSDKSDTFDSAGARPKRTGTNTRRNIATGDLLRRSPLLVVKVSIQRNPQPIPTAADRQTVPNTATHPNRSMSGRQIGNMARNADIKSPIELKGESTPRDIENRAGDMLHATRRIARRETHLNVRTVLSRRPPFVSKRSRSLSAFRGCRAVKRFRPMRFVDDLRARRLTVIERYGISIHIPQVGRIRRRLAKRSGLSDPPAGF